MESAMEYLGRLGQTILTLANQFTFKDVIDVVIVTLLLYGAIKLVRETRAGQLVKGILLLVFLFIISYQLDLMMLTAILRAFLSSGIVIVVILFQPEIRKALEQVGHSKVVQSMASAVSAKNKEEGQAATRRAIEGVVDATQILQQLRMGALIVFERQTKLGEIVDTGTIVEAAPSAQLIANIFFNTAPLHDGAMIIREGQVYAAGCILPLTSNVNVSAELGTRHRAAMGMSENSDAVVVIVSEETGQISVAVEGKFTRNYNRLTLRQALEEALIGAPDEASGSKRILGKLGLGGRASKKGG